MLGSSNAIVRMGAVKIRGTLGVLDPLNKVPFKGAISRFRKGPLEGFKGSL